VAVHKRRPQSGRIGVCPVRKFFGQVGFFRCGRPYFLVKKSSGFSKFMICPHRQGRLNQCEHFSDRGGQFFAILYGRPLWTAPKLLSVRVCQQKWLRMRFEPMSTSIKDVPWDRDRGNPNTIKHVHGEFCNKSIKFAHL